MPVPADPVVWTAVDGVQPVVFVGRIADRPSAIIEMKPTSGFRLTTCQGDRIGEFHRLEEAKAAYTAWLDDTAHAV